MAVWRNLTFGTAHAYGVTKSKGTIANYNEDVIIEWEQPDDSIRFRDTLKFKQLSEFATKPTRSHHGDLGYDLYAAESIRIGPNTKQKISTGIAFQFPIGWGGFVKDRSSMATNTTLETIGGVIDNGYTGELFIVFANYGDTTQHIQQGQKIAQLVLIPVTNFEIEEVDEIVTNDGRGENGFGSTGE